MGTFRKIVAPTVQELFLREMMSALLSGVYRPGDQLPSECTLADEIGVSKTVVQNGLKELERTGFVEIQPHKGVYAANFMKTGNLDTFYAIVRYSIEHLGNENVSHELIQCSTDILLTIDKTAFQLFVENREIRTVRFNS